MTEWLDEPDKDEFEHDGLKRIVKMKRHPEGTGRN